MRVKPKIVVRNVKLLRDPEASYVSLVDHGAVQVPWATVKHAGNRQTKLGVKKMPVLKRPKAKPVAKTESQEASRNLGILKITFATTEYPTQASVEKYLTDNNYDGYKIETAKGAFIAASADLTDESFVENTVKQVAAEKGVVAHVGTLKAEDASDKTDGEDTGEDNTGGESQDGESIVKFSFYDAYYSDAKSPIDVIKDGMSDGLPPGMDDIMFAVTRSIANTIKEGGESMPATIDQIGKDMSKLVKGLAAMYAALGTEEAQKAVKALSKDKQGNVVKFAERTEAEIAKATEEPKAETAATEEPKDKTDKSAALQPVAIDPAMIEAAVKAALTSVVAKVEEIAESHKELADRVTRMASRAPTQKSDKSSDTPAPELTPAQKRAEESKVNNKVLASAALKNSIGL